MLNLTHDKRSNLIIIIIIIIMSWISHNYLKYTLMLTLTCTYFVYDYTFILCMIILLWAIKTNQQKYWLNLKVPRKKKQKHKDIGIEQKVNTIKSLMFYLNDIEFYIK